MSVAQRERAALITTMRDVGPDHPTLCGQWSTRDLAAHLVVRERRRSRVKHGARLERQLVMRQVGRRER